MTLCKKKNAPAQEAFFFCSATVTASAKLTRVYYVNMYVNAITFLHIGHDCCTVSHDFSEHIVGKVETGNLPCIHEIK